MILLIALTAFALLVLLFGFLEIKIPFVSARKYSNQHAIFPPKPPIKLEDNLVKKSIEASIRTTKFLKVRLPENADLIEDEYYQAGV